MNQLQAYRHCPLCASILKPPVENLLECTSCHYHLYINPKPCNAVIIENDNKEILLVKRKFDPHKGKWDLPGGFIAPFETFQKSIDREISEELGVSIKIGRYIGTYTDVYEYRNTQYSTIAVVLTATIISGTIKAADDISAYKYFPKEEVLKQQIAFNSLREALIDYLTLSTSI